MTDDHSYVLIRFVTEASPCPYLPDESSQLEYRVPATLDAESLERLIERGWRRFGNYVFRPRCRVCRKCRPLRIVLEDFHPSKSQRRALRRNQNVELHVTQPQVSDEHVALFNAYHRDMAERRGWPDNATSFQNYYESFIGRPNEFAREFQYREDGRLIGVGRSLKRLLLPRSILAKAESWHVFHSQGNRMGEDSFDAVLVPRILDSRKPVDGLQGSLHASRNPRSVRRPRRRTRLENRR